MRTLRSASLLSLAVWLSAANAWAIRPLPPNAVLLNLVPEECVFFAHSLGFGAPDLTSQNKTEQLLADAEVQAFFGEMKHVVSRGVRRALEQNESDEERQQIGAIFSIVRKLATRPMTIYCAKFDPADDQPLVEMGLVVDLGNLEREVHDELSKLSEKALADGKAAETTIGSIDCIELRADGNPPAYWAVQDGLLFVTVGDRSLANLVGQLSSTRPLWLGPIVERMSIEQQNFVGYLNFNAVDRLVAAGGDPEGIRAWREFGFEGLDYLAVGIGLEGSGLVTKAVLTFSELKGFFKLYDQSGLSQQDLARIPGSATSATALQLNLAQLFDLFMDFMGEMNPDSKAEFTHGLRQVSAMLGVDVRNDFLEALGDKWVFYQTGDDAMIMVPDYAASVLLRDEAVVRRSVDALVRFASGALAGQPGIPISIMATKFGDANGYTIRGLPVALSFCVHNNELIVGLSGEAIKRHLSYRPDVANSLAIDTRVMSLLNDRQPIVLSYSDVAATLRTVYPSLRMMVNLMSGPAAQQGIDYDPTTLPALSTITKYLEPSIISVKRTDDGIEMEAHEVLPRISAPVGGAPVAVALLLPAVNAARAAARRTQSMNNLRQLCLGTLNYESAYNRFPRAGQNGLSWRVRILPFLDETALYDDFHLDEPWDSEHNRRLIDKMPAVFASPTSKLNGGRTNYLAIRGPDPVIADAEKGTRIADIHDGTSNTILFVEVDDDLAVTWTKPDDFDWNADDPAKGLGNLQPGDIFLAVFCDGSAQAISKTIDKNVLAALFTKSGKEVVDRAALDP